MGSELREVQVYPGLLESDKIESLRLAVILLLKLNMVLLHYSEWRLSTIFGREELEAELLHLVRQLDLEDYSGARKTAQRNVERLFR